MVSWDNYFMLQAMVASFKSKDPDTKVGCVFVDEKNHQISMGYNGFVAGINEEQLSWEKNRSLPLVQQKHGHVVHSEANAILHASRPLEGARLYVTLFPCHECAKLIASCRIQEVIYFRDKEEGSESNECAKKIFMLAGIPCRRLTVREALVHELSDYLKTLTQDHRL